MSARIRRVARDGDPSGQDYSGRSEAAQAIVTAWANHEAASGRPLDPTRIPTGLRTLLLDPRCGGGRYYRERGLPGSAGVYVPRKPADTEGRLDHDWRRAVELVTTRPAVGDHSTARLEIAEIRGALDDDPKRWAGQAGPTDRIVLEFLLAKAHDLGSLCPPASAREVADGTGISRTAASNALNRLCAEKAWLRLERPSAGVHANVCRLRRPTRCARASALSSAAEAGLDRSLARARMGPPGSSVPARPRRLPAVHDAFVHGRGLGRTSRRIWELLTDVGLTARDIVEVTGLHPRTVRHRLEDLQAAGLARVQLWDVTDRARPRPLGSPLTGIPEVIALAFTRDGRTLATGSIDNRLRLWDVTDRARPRPLGPPLTGRQLAFAPDGRTLATGSGDRANGRVQLWDVTDRARPRPLGSPLTGHTGEVSAVAFASDRRTLVTGSPDTVRLWDVIIPTRPRPLGQLTDRGVDTVAFAPDGYTMATGSSGRVRLWDVADPARPRSLGQLTGHVDAVFAVGFAPDGRTLATGGADTKVWLWDVAAWARARPLGQLTGIGRVSAVAFAPDGRTLATGSGTNTVRLWDVTDRARPRSLGLPLTGRTGDVSAVVFAPDGRTLATNGSPVRLWDVTDATRPRTLSQLTGIGWVSAVAFARDGHLLATLSVDDTVRLWDVTQRTQPRSVGQMSSGRFASEVALSPGGRTLASEGSYSTIQLWDVADPTQPRPLGPPLAGRTGGVAAVAFAPDGRTLATGSTDTVRL